MTTLQGKRPGRARQGDEPGPLVDPRHHCGRAAHGGARHDDHDHRPALGAARARVLQHGPAVGGHGLYVGLRRLPPPRRAHQRHDRAEAHADDRRRRLRPGVGRRRSVADDTHVDRRPRAAGSLRRAVGPLGAVDPHLDLLRPARTWPGLRDLRHHRHRRLCLRAHPRRLLDPVRRLALVPLRQPPDRGAGALRRLATDPHAAGHSGHPAGRARRGPRVRRPGRPRVRPGRSRHQRMGRHPCHRVAGRLGCAPERVRPVAEQGPQSPPPAARGAQPEPGRLIHHDPAGRHRDVRDVPLPHLPAADDRPLLPPQDRHRLPPAHGHERAGGHAGGQPPDAPRAHPAVGGPGPPAGRARRLSLHAVDP